MAVTKGIILIADDDEQICKFLEVNLQKEGYKTYTANSLNECKALVSENQIDVTFLDISFPEGNSISILPDIVSKDGRSHVIMLTASNSVDHAVRAMKLGAYDYIQKPFQMERILTSLNHALRQLKATREIERLQSSVKSNYHFSNIVGESKSMRDLFDLIKQLSNISVSVLLQAESGTGKELVAKAIHFNGDRSKNPFVVVNCAAIPENLIESELFGHEKGSFTGANSSRMGKFETAHEGTIFLDEIGEMPLPAQTKLLRVLQEKEFERVGGDKTIKVDVRVIAATNNNLMDLVKQKLFREDLYYRLSVFPVSIPPLSGRSEDIPLLAAYFIDKYKDESANTIKGIEPEAMKILTDHNWPGNVRELENTIHRAVIVAQGEYISMKDLHPEILKINVAENSKSIEDNDSKKIKPFDEIERDAINDALQAVNGDITRAAKNLGLGRATLYRKVKKYELKK